MWRHSQAVRQRSAKPLFPSSILGAASTKTYKCTSRGGGTGRRNGLKIRRLEIIVPVRFRSSAPIGDQRKLISFFMLIVLIWLVQTGKVYSM